MTTTSTKDPNRRPEKCGQCGASEHLTVTTETDKVRVITCKRTKGKDGWQGGCGHEHYIGLPASVKVAAKLAKEGGV